MTERDNDVGPRVRTVAHMRQLMAAATALGVANGAVACTKPKDAPDAGDDVGKQFGPPDPSTAVTAPPVMNPAPDPTLTAESTPDAATFAGPDAARARADAGRPKDPGRGYRVVDPLPRPTRINCNPPYTVDANGKKKYKAECIE
jgi:hypothetical protein